MPANFSVLEKCEPVYEEVPGWSEDIRTVKKDIGFTEGSAGIYQVY